MLVQCCAIPHSTIRVQAALRVVSLLAPHARAKAWHELEQTHRVQALSVVSATHRSKSVVPAPPDGAPPVAVIAPPVAAGAPPVLGVVPPLLCVTPPVLAPPVLVLAPPVFVLAPPLAEGAPPVVTVTSPPVDTVELPPVVAAGVPPVDAPPEPSGVAGSYGAVSSFSGSPCAHATTIKDAPIRSELFRTEPAIAVHYRARATIDQLVSSARMFPVLLRRTSSMAEFVPDEVH